MSSFDIQETLGVASEEILAKRHNLFVGASDTPWFRDGRRLEELVTWAVEHTRDSLLVCLPGRLYSSNVFHVDKEGRASALKRGYQLEDTYRARIESVLRDHPRRETVRVIGYGDLHTREFVMRKEALYRAFSIRRGFYQRVIEVAKEYLVARQRPTDDLRAEAIAVYQLQELPIFISPMSTIDSHTTHSAVIYPGFGKFDLLAHDLATSDKFPEIPNWFKPETPMGIASVRLVG